MACSLGNKCAKNLCKRTVLVQLIIKNVVTFFWNTVIKGDISNLACRRTVASTQQRKQKHFKCGK